MAKVSVEATINIQRTKTVEVTVRVGDVKGWLKEQYGSPSEHGMAWNDPHVLGEYVQAHDDLISQADGNIDDTSDEWEVQYAEEV